VHSKFPNRGRAGFSCAEHIFTLELVLRLGPPLSGLITEMTATKGAVKLRPHSHGMHKALSKNVAITHYNQPQ